jgi:hypothetical protein
MEEKRPENPGTCANWRPPRGRRWREEDARAGPAAARASGKPLSRFPREHGLEASRLYWWMKALSEKPAKPAAFLPVHVVEGRAPSEQREIAARQGTPSVPCFVTIPCSAHLMRVPTWIPRRAAASFLVSMPRFRTSTPTRPPRRSSSAAKDGQPGRRSALSSGNP